MTAMSAALIATAAVLAQQPSTPLFKTGVDLVRIDALVLDDGGPVPGLGPQDFEIRDNGVRQSPASVTMVTDVTAAIVLDVSGSMTGERMTLAIDAAQTLLRELKDTDRFSVVAFGDQVTAVVDSTMSLDEARAHMGLLRPGGSTALLDATFAGILYGDRAPGPKLLLVMTDGRNNVSWLKARDVIEAARRHETVIYPVAVALGPGYQVPGHGPVIRDAAALLELMARQTGGRVMEAEWNTDLERVFSGILREYRQRYIVTFTPESVGTGDGWHTLDVKVKRRGATVRARSQYWAGPN